MTDSRVMVIAGASGVVGRHLITAARARGWRLRVLTRSTAAGSLPVVDDDAPQRLMAWSPQRAAGDDAAAQRVVARALEGADVVVNLAGASLSEGRLDAPHRRRVRDSRVDATRALVRGWLRASNPPAVWVQASAVGYYGDTGETQVDESAPQGRMFLSEVCHAWEETARSVREELGEGRNAPRQIMARLGLVLAEDAPAWEKMLQPVRLGLGGALGSGKQWWSWIDADELAEALFFLIERESAEGVYNLTTPEPVRQLDLVRAAARRLDRPAILPAPAAALRLLLGAVADELLLASCKALPTRLEAEGYTFRTPGIAAELDQLLGA